MSKDIDFEFGRSIGATHYATNRLFVSKWHKVSDDKVSYWSEKGGMWFDYPDSSAAILHLDDAIEIPPADPWTIHNNDKPLCELSDEQAAQLVNAWRKNQGILELVDGQWCYTKPMQLSLHGVFRIEQKSERDEFVEKCMIAAGQEPLITGMGFKNAYLAIFDAIQRGDIKAPEVSK